ncbi:MAG: PilZ domain-containing protein [Candidatus Omnitrophica bacterium]|nr:PilZ domain-containing protein [Candidatus Omnitrophota bacterium]MCM8770422.1 PilZ domain-containing protein [Candidatus Omnitrophota bacterium]
MSKRRQERRKYPRINKNLPLSIALKGADFVVETKNISCGGAYCHVDRYIKPLTKLAICINLPDTKRNIFCKGVVVRTEEAVPTGYNIAIFFNEIDKKDLNVLSNYIHHHLAYEQIQ